nr:DNA-processing protein DprA [Pseudoroseicyclus aestuarii]
MRSRRVGPATYWRLLAEHGSASAALEALPQVARAAGVEDYRPCPEGPALAEIEAGRRAGARLILAGDPDWPAGLDDLADRPPMLWVAGRGALLSRPMLSLVGARGASSLGLRMARRLAAELSEAGWVVVSGLARGVDAAAHEAALEGGTIAVMAGGVDHIYPSENTELARKILDARGVRLSEQPMGLVPQARHFPSRNRIIAGLSRAVVVVEAAARSGSLITARAALDAGREVLAVPGHPFDARASGCNMLIRDGATLIRSASDVLEALGPLAPMQPQLALPVKDMPAVQDAGPHPAPTLPRASSAEAPDSTRTPLSLRATPEAPRYAPPPAQTEATPLEAPEPAQSGSKRGGSSALRQAARLHSKILSRLGPSPVAEDQLIRDLGASAREVTPALVDLELEGQILRQPGGLLSRHD